MNIKLKLDEQDFLTHQLFVASKSERIKKKRQRSKIIYPIIYIGLALFYLFASEYFGALFFFTLGFGWYLLYPIWERRHYVSHYKNFIKDNFNTKISRDTSIEFNDDFIIMKDDGGESKIVTKEIEAIVEIAKIIFVKLKDGTSIILPKDKINNIEILKPYLTELAKKLDINFETELNWSWK